MRMAASAPEYFFSNKLRHVRPYYRTYKTPVKGRWLDRTLVEVYTEDLHHNQDRTEKQIHNGGIYILQNHGQKTGSARVSGWDNLSQRRLQRHDIVCNLAHIHEPSVPYMESEVVYEDDDLYVVNKPSGIPTHPTGSFFYNSMTEILKSNLADVSSNIFLPCHRLDRATLGILILAKHSKAAAQFAVNSKTSNVAPKKEYLARVMGKFPEGTYTVMAPIFNLNAAGGFIGQSNSSQLPADSTTEFTRLQYSLELDQSVVLCKPITGRTHQIRIHLRNVGHPIVNDPFYNENIASDSTKINNSIELELYSRINHIYPQFNTLLTGTALEQEYIPPATINFPSITRFDLDNELQTKLLELKALKQEEFAKSKNAGGVCPECNQQTHEERSVETMNIWLHSYRYLYERGDKRFETSLPDWYHV